MLDGQSQRYRLKEEKEEFGRPISTASLLHPTILLALSLLQPRWVYARVKGRRRRKLITYRYFNFFTPGLQGEHFKDETFVGVRNFFASQTHPGSKDDGNSAVFLSSSLLLFLL